MSTASLIGVYAKIERAKHHLLSLCEELQRWGSSNVEGKPKVLYTMPGDKTMRLSIEGIEPSDLEWGLIIGDVVHNLRSSLDHLVCQLALLNGQSSSCFTKLQFPICIDENSFKDSRAKLERFIGASACALIEELQPYKSAKLRGVDPATNCLWIVKELDNIDKHRVLVLPGKEFQIAELRQSVNDGPLLPVNFVPQWIPLRNGVEIANVDFSGFDPKADDKMNAEARLSISIVFSETGTAWDGADPQLVLGPSIKYVWELAQLFESQFFPK